MNEPLVIIHTLEEGRIELTQQEWFTYKIMKRVLTLHRLDGPAVVLPNEERWYAYGKLHRLDGPAVIYNTSSSWYINGNKYRNKKSVDRHIARIRKLPLVMRLTDERWWVREFKDD